MSSVKKRQFYKSEFKDVNRGQGRHAEFWHSTIILLENLFDPGEVFGYLCVDVGFIWIAAVAVKIERHDTCSFPAAHQWAPGIPLWGGGRGCIWLLDFSKTVWKTLKLKFLYWKHTWQNPLLVPYPPAQSTLAGRSFTHFPLQTSGLTMGTSTTFSSLTVFPPVLVKPHPATRHFDLSFIFISTLGSWIFFTLLPSRAFLNSWRHTERQRG